jgi:hypothetical protein
MDTKKTHTPEEISYAPLFHLELVQDRMIPYGKASTTAGAVEILHRLLDSAPTERLAVLWLNSVTEIVGAEIVGMGGLEMVGQGPTEIFRGAILKAVPEVIVCHNHPGNGGIGNIKPSIPDIKFTTSMITAGGMLGIRVRDHIIVGPNNHHYSIYDHQHELRDDFRRAESDMFGIDMSSLKDKLMESMDRIHSANPAKKTEGGKKGDPNANSLSDWKHSLTYAWLTSK